MKPFVVFCLLLGVALAYNGCNIGHNCKQCLENSGCYYHYSFKESICQSKTARSDLPFRVRKFHLCPEDEGEIETTIPATVNKDRVEFLPTSLKNEVPTPNFVEKDAPPSVGIEEKVHADHDVTTARVTSHREQIFGAVVLIEIPDSTTMNIVQETNSEQLVHSKPTFHTNERAEHNASTLPKPSHEQPIKETITKMQAVVSTVPPREQSTPTQHSVSMPVRLYVTEETKELAQNFSNLPQSTNSPQSNGNEQTTAAMEEIEDNPLVVVEQLESETTSQQISVDDVVLGQVDMKMEHVMYKNQQSTISLEVEIGYNTTTENPSMYVDVTGRYESIDTESDQEKTEGSDDIVIMMRELENPFREQKKTNNVLGFRKELAYYQCMQYITIRTQIRRRRDTLHQKQRNFIRCMHRIE